MLGFTNIKNCFRVGVKKKGNENGKTKTVFLSRMFLSCDIERKSIAGYFL